MVDFLAQFFTAEMVILILVLNSLGAVLKHFVDTLDNRLIPLFLLCVAILLETYIGIRVDGMNVLDAIVLSGFRKGFIATAIAVLGWDTIYGSIKTGVAFFKKKKGKKV